MPVEGNEAFWADRERRFGLRPEAFRAMVPELRQAFAAHLARLEAMLADGRPFLGGDQPGHGDLAHAMLLWFAARGRPAQQVSAALAPWALRVFALGHGRPEAMTGADALAEARTAAPSVAGDGPLVRVSQPGSADLPVEGRLVREDADGFTLLRESPEPGQVAVHFPREGQQVARV
jgi:glutathione S-transferase